jgi:hypothetical protein
LPILGPTLKLQTPQLLDRFEEAAAMRARQQAGLRRSVANMSGRRPSHPVSSTSSDSPGGRSPQGQLSPAVGGTPTAELEAEQEKPPAKASAGGKLAS